jgi:hypothetical protein
MTTIKKNLSAIYVFGCSFWRLAKYRPSRATPTLNPQCGQDCAWSDISSSHWGHSIMPIILPTHFLARRVQKKRGAMLLISPHSTLYPMSADPFLLQASSLGLEMFRDKVKKIVQQQQ